MSASLKQISSLLNGFSTEVTPTSASKVNNFQEHLSLGTSVNVTFLAGSNLKDTVQVCKRLNEEGFNPVPHIVARNFENTMALEIFLDLLVSTANVCEVLVIAGGIARPLGPFSDSLQILNSGLLEKYQIKIIQYFDGNYIKSFFKNNDIDFTQKTYSIKNGINENEVKLVPKNSKNLGFFERFFQLFS